MFPKRKEESKKERDKGDIDEITEGKRGDQEKEYIQSSLYLFLIRCPWKVQVDRGSVCIAIKAKHRGSNTEVNLLCS